MGSREGRCARCQWGGGGSGGWPGVGPAPSEPAVHCVCDPGVDVGTSRVRIYHPPRPSSVAASGVARAGSLPPTAAGPPAVGVQARGSGVPRRWRSIEGGPRGERVVRGGTRVLSASVRYVSGPEPRRGPACHVAPENTCGRARRASVDARFRPPHHVRGDVAAQNFAVETFIPIRLLHRSGEPHVPSRRKWCTASIESHSS